MEFETKHNPDCIGMSFEEYKKYETKDRNKLATLAYSMFDEGDKLFELTLKLKYYSECFEELSAKQTDIIAIWSDLMKIYDSLPFAENLSSFQSDLILLAELTVKSGLPKKDKEILDDSVISYFQNRVNQELQTREFDAILSDMVEWYYFKVKYYEVLQISSTETELNHLQIFSKKNIREFERIKFEMPILFISYSNCVKWYYEHLPKITDKNYDAFFKRIMLSKIAVFRNIGELDKMSDTIYEYYSTRRGNKLVSWFLDYFSGYGEKPLRIVRLFLCLHVTFDSLLLIPFFKLKGIPDTASVWQKLISTVYFNNTTFLTIGYGDILPDNAQTMIVVILEQILGFIVAGAFVTLMLRKQFRF